MAVSMSSPESLLQAAVNRLLARMGSGMADAAAAVAVIAQDAPDRLRQEWELFREEVQMEAERLDAESSSSNNVEPGESPPSASSDPLGKTDHPGGASDRSAQQRIDDLRTQVSALSSRIEEPG